MAMRIAALALFTIACSTPGNPSDSAQVPASFFDNPVLHFESALRRGPGYEAIVIPTVPTDVELSDDRIRIVNADRSLTFFEARVQSRDNLKKTMRIEVVSPGQGSLLLAGIGGESGRAAEVTRVSFDHDLLLIEVSFWDAGGGRWEFVESLRVPAKQEPDPVRVDVRRFSVIRTSDYVVHPDVSGGPMEWYASHETPERALEDLRFAVEAWNRYFRLFGPDKLHFAGYLPEGIAAGDPRYNVIVVSNNDPGAAWESQGYNPYTGLQTHSMIFVPLAWYYRGAGSAESTGLPKVPSLLPLSIDEAREQLEGQRQLPRPPRTAPMLPGLALQPSCAYVPQTTDYGPMLFRAVVMHEVGHALGLGHNFRASATADINLLGTAEFHFTDSIMDYNIYPFEERYLFHDGSTADGPLLPYDKHVIDAIYNGGALFGGEPPRPVCTDADVYSQLPSAVDPTCWPYDFFSDPVTAVRAARARLQSADVRLQQTQGQLQTLVGAAATPVQQAKIDIETNVPTAFDTLGETLGSVLLDVARFDNISAGNVVSSYMRLVAQWELPEKPIQELGTAFPANFFNAAGTFDRDGYIAYQRVFRGELLAVVEDALSITRDDNDALARRIFDMTWQKTTAPAGSDLLTAAAHLKGLVAQVADGKRAQLGMSTPDIDAGVQTANKAIDKATLRTAAQLVFDVYWTLPDFPGEAPYVMPDIATRIFTAANAAALDGRADPDARFSAFLTMAWLHLTRPYADGIATADARAAAFDDLRTAVASELSALGQKRVMDGYLSVDDSERFARLNDIAVNVDRLFDLL